VTDNGFYDYPVSAFPPATRVELHPSTDLWMSGARYGAIVSAGYSRVKVRLDINGREVNLRRVLVRPVDDAS
jgi:hypothetical protein